MLMHSSRRNFVVVPMFVVASLLSLEFLGLADTLALDRGRVEEGAWYLLLSGNFVHLNLNHLWLNLAGYVLLVVALQGDIRWSSHLFCIVCCALFVGLGVYCFVDGIDRYYGFSGILHGLMVFFALSLRSSQAPLVAWAAMAVVSLKVGHEWWLGASETTSALINGKVIVESHLAGWLGGLVSYVCVLAGNRYRKVENHVQN